LYSKATFLKMLQTPEFDFFRRKIGINWHFVLKRIVPILKIRQSQ
jgi:hypothetical protein